MTCLFGRFGKRSQESSGAGIGLRPDLLAAALRQRLLQRQQLQQRPRGFFAGGEREEAEEVEARKIMEMLERSGDRAKIYQLVV